MALRLMLAVGLATALLVAAPPNSSGQATAGSQPNPQTAPPTGDRASGGTATGLTDREGQTPAPAGIHDKKATPTGNLGSRAAASSGKSRSSKTGSNENKRKTANRTKK